MGDVMRQKILLIVCAMMLVLPGCMFKQEFGGLGIEVPAGQEKVSEKNPFLIVSIFKGGTGELAGLQEGDEIISVDGVPLKGLKQEYIVKNLLRGKVGSTALLEIKREKNVLVYRVQRGKIVLRD